MSSKSSLKLIAFSLARQEDGGPYFEVLSLLQAYQLMRAYAIPQAKLTEFWDAGARRLETFIGVVQDFLAKHTLALPALVVPCRLSEKRPLVQLEDRYAVLYAAFAVMKAQVKAGQRVSLLVDHPQQRERFAGFLQKYELMGVGLLPFKLFVKALLGLKIEADLERINFVFTSPYLQTDLAQRHARSAELYGRLHAYVDLATFATKVPEWQPFAQLVLPEAETVAHWLSWLAQVFEMLMVRVPEEFFEAVRAYFDQGAFLGRLTYKEFLQCFDFFVEDHEILANQHFQVLEFSEFAGVQADHYWYVPSEAAFRSVHPFLPLALQREYGLIFEVSTYFDVREFSVPQQHKQNSGLAYRAPLQTEVLREPQYLQVQKQVGGAQLLNEQAACPFKAFAHFQLQARAMVREEAWLNAKFRGVAVHRVLERLWLELKDLSGLLRLNEAELQDLVRSKTSQVLMELSQSAMFFLPKALLDLEVRRLSKLILLWLDLEKQRPYFKVLSLEQKSLAYLGPLIIQLRLDRIDELENGQRMVIDYKTGSVSAKDWFTEPLEDVQLPLYLLISEAHAAALAQVTLEPKFSGIVRDEIERFSELKVSSSFGKKTWDEWRVWWQEKIHALAEDVIAGVARVQPLPHACDYCDLQALCRVAERGGL